MRIFKTKWMVRFAQRERITDASLVAAMKQASAGKVDAELASGLIKQRVARQGHGKSGGYRMIVAFRVKERAVFMFGFAKNVQDNIGPKELEAFKTAAANWLQMSDQQIEMFKEDGAISEIEVEYDEKDKS